MHACMHACGYDLRMNGAAPCIGHAASQAGSTALSLRTMPHTAAVSVQQLAKQRCSSQKIKGPQACSEVMEVPGIGGPAALSVTACRYACCRWPCWGHVEAPGTPLPQFKASAPDASTTAAIACCPAWHCVVAGLCTASPRAGLALAAAGLAHATRSIRRACMQHCVQPASAFIALCAWARMRLHVHACRCLLTSGPATLSCWSSSRPASASPFRRPQSWT